MSNQTKHTPGPWRVGDACHAIYGPKKADGSLPAYIAEVSSSVSVRSNHQWRWNAQLIAAAPELLAVCECWAKWCEQNHIPEAQGIACETFAAIAKAEGRQ